MEKSSRPPIVTIHGSADEGAVAAALELADLVEAKPDAVLGLATGGTMVGVYAAFVREARARSLDVSRVRTFNLDEYLGLAVDDAKRFRHFMELHLFGPLSIPSEHAHFPDAERAQTDAVGAARDYESAIEAAGGIDLQLLGIGRNGHIAFNEPGSSPDSRTRVIELHGATRADAAPSFGGLAGTPERAITMGMGTILEARALRVLAFGEAKAPVVERMLHGEEDPETPCTFLRGRHGDLAVHLDRDAARLLH
ncbi:Glucosamine-6-phosphate deaminase 1 [Planctomycetes bacterium Poly30]|uniref:Glucosamine-6-phosphate deaminase 1 n=1 Tax=Saltatorellus ferox TaxID=2528018 RepID=A0A518ESF6_9BACT|nr:Glucosamine-6-phosphate deaminase 1 [Planctomycetes bacterium Poly30]